VAEQVSQRETVTAMATSSMSVAHVAEQVSQRETVTATETNSTSVAHVVEQVSQKETVTATETNSTPSEFVVVTAKQTPMAMASVTMTKCQDVKTIQRVTSTYLPLIQSSVSILKESVKHALGKMMELELSSITTATETAYVIKTKCQDVKTIQRVTTTYSLRIQTTAASLPKEFAKHALGKMMELEPSSTTTATETAYVTM